MSNASVQKKICMIGSFSVGKTSLVRRFVESIFTDKYHTTIGVKIDKKVVDHQGRKVQLVLWDIAGDDPLKSFRESYVRGASGYLLVVDGTRRATLPTAIDLQARVQKILGPVPFFLVLNKADRKAEWEIDMPIVKARAASGWRVLESSAKTGEGVEAMFQELTASMLDPATSASA